MRIKLISPALHAELEEILASNPELCFQNNGYEYLSPEIRADKAAQLERVEVILREHVVGFVKFFNFRRSRSGEIELRFDYDWGADGNTQPFTGVGYALLDHLRDGFPEGQSQA